MQKELTFVESLKLMTVIAAMLAAMLFVSGCDMATTQATATADSSKVAPPATAGPELLGAWRVTSSGLDSLKGVVFLASGRYIRSNPSCGSSGNGVMICEPDIESGTWTVNAGTVGLSSDSSGVLRTSRLVNPDDRCDSLICWQQEKTGFSGLAYVVQGSRLMLGSTTYDRQ